MKLAVIGSRKWKDCSVIRSIINQIKPTEIITGGAQGVDHMAMDIAKCNNLFLVVFRPEWNKYGKRAGAIRNKKIVDYCDQLIAFWDGKSKGTKISIDMAYKAGKLRQIYRRIF